MRLSVIIPALNEALAIESAIRSAASADEVIVVDGGSSDRTCDIAAALGARVAESQPGRGRQLARGAELATGDVLLFLHADTILPSGARSQIQTALGHAEGLFARLVRPAQICFWHADRARHLVFIHYKEQVISLLTDAI